MEKKFNINRNVSINIRAEFFSKAWILISATYLMNFITNKPIIMLGISIDKDTVDDLDFSVLDLFETVSSMRLLH